MPKAKKTAKKAKQKAIKTGNSNPNSINPIIINLPKFALTDKDRRDEFIDAVENKKEYIAQKLPLGTKKSSDVELFDPNFGFYLGKKQEKVNLDLQAVQRAYSSAKLSKRFAVRLGLREGYYVLRGDPLLNKFYAGVKGGNIYSEYVDHLNTLEILTGTDRINYIISTNSRGYVYYPFSNHYGDKARKVAFSEELVVETLTEDDFPYLQHHLIVEKEAATKRLIEMGFLKLVNASVITVGGAFSRAIYRFTKDYSKKFNLDYFCDGDIYGNKILSTTIYGSKRSRHLNLRESEANLNILGLFPYVGEKIGLPNDVEEKRPLQKPWAIKMLEHLKEFDLVDDLDVETWERDKTYELEALSARFTSKDNKPVGLGIYLIEYFRLKNLPIKPLPPDDVDGDYESEIDWYVPRKLKPKAPKDFITKITKRIDDELTQPLKDLENDIKDILNFLFSGIRKIHINRQDVDTIKNHLIRQYCRKMERPIYDVDLLAQNQITANTTITYDPAKLQALETEVNNAIDDFIARIKPLFEDMLKDITIESNLKLDDLDPNYEPCDLYDKVVEKIKAKTKDVKLIREALAERLKIKLP